MKYLSIICAFLLAGCSKTAPSTAITEQVKSDIVVIEKQIEDVKVNCKSEERALDIIKANLNLVKGQVETIDLSCKQEKNLFIEKNNKLKIINLFLTIILILLLYILIKKR